MLLDYNLIGNFEYRRYKFSLIGLPPPKEFSLIGQFTRMYNIKSHMWRSMGLHVVTYNTCNKNLFKMRDIEISNFIVSVGLWFIM
jgi:hypothetical protein